MALPDLDTRSVLNVVEENFDRIGLVSERKCNFLLKSMHSLIYKRNFHF